MGRPQKRNSARNISDELLDSAMRPVPVIEKLKRRPPVAASEHVTVRDFAAELNVEPERIRPLLDRQYIRIIKAEPYLEDTLIARPYAVGVKWLKRMFAPLRLVPLLPLHNVAMLLGLLTVDDVRHLCLNYDITVHDDVVFGELLSVSDFYRLWRNLYISRYNRFDRQMMMFMINNAKGKSEKNPRAMDYYDALEEEIKRVSRMEEPDRTFRATALYEAFRDVQKISEVQKTYQEKLGRKKSKLERIEKLFRNLLRKSLGTTAYRPDAEPYAVQPPASSAASHRE